MNLLFFLTPKSEVAYVEDNDSLRQVLEKMEYHGYTAVPLLSADGRYLGTITEGDVLWKLKKEGFPDIHEMENISVMQIVRKRDNKAVHANVDMEGLLERVMRQNFVPVVDDEKTFIGIVTRKDVILYLMKEVKKRERENTYFIKNAGVGGGCAANQERPGCPAGPFWQKAVISSALPAS